MRSVELAVTEALAPLWLANEPVTLPPEREKPVVVGLAPVKLATEVTAPLLHLIVNTNLALIEFATKSEQRFPPLLADVFIGFVVRVPPLGAPAVDDVHPDKEALATFVTSAFALPLAMRAGVKLTLVVPKLQVIVPTRGFFAAHAAVPAIVKLVTSPNGTAVARTTAITLLRKAMVLSFMSCALRSTNHQDTSGCAPLGPKDLALCSKSPEMTESSDLWRHEYSLW